MNYTKIQRAVKQIEQEKADKQAKEDYSKIMKELNIEVIK